MNYPHSQTVIKFELFKNAQSRYLDIWLVSPSFIYRLCFLLSRLERMNTLKIFLLLDHIASCLFILWVSCKQSCFCQNVDVAECTSTGTNSRREIVQYCNWECICIYSNSICILELCVCVCVCCETAESWIIFVQFLGWSIPATWLIKQPPVLTFLIWKSPLTSHLYHASPLLQARQ